MAQSTPARRWVLDPPARLALAAVIVVANLGGAVVVFALAAWVLPEGPLADPTQVRTLNFGAFAAYLLVSVPVGLSWGALLFRLRDPDAENAGERARQTVLHGPMRLITVEATLWIVAVVLFAGLNLRYSPRLALLV